jgi:hypothetical protein
VAEAATSTSLRPLVPLRVVGAAAEWLALDPTHGLVVVERLHVSPETEQEFLDAVATRAERLVGQRDPGLRALLAIRRTGGGVELVSEASGSERLAVAAGRAWRDGQLELDVAASIGVALADALGALHGRDMVHGPLTPHEVDLGADGRVELTAHVRRAAVVALRPGSVPVPVAYFAPELVQGRPPSTASDVFGLAILCWELMAGERLFAREDEGRTTARALSCRVPPLGDVRPEAPEALTSLLDRALDRNPGRRPTLEALRRGLAEHACDPETRTAWVQRQIGDRLAAWAATGDSARRGEAPDAPEPEGTALWPLDARVDAAPGGSERAASAPTWPAVAQSSRRAPRGERPASVGSPLSLPVGERIEASLEARPTLPTGADAARDTLPSRTSRADRGEAARTAPAAAAPEPDRPGASSATPAGIAAAVTIPAEAPPRPAVRPRTPLPLGKPAPRVALPPRPAAPPGPRPGSDPAPAREPRPASDPAPDRAEAATGEAVAPPVPERSAAAEPVTAATAPEETEAAATPPIATTAPERPAEPSPAPPQDDAPAAAAPVDEERSASVELDARALAGAHVSTPLGRRAEPTQVVRIKGEARYVRPPEGETPEPEATEARERTRQIRVSTLDPDDAMVIELQSDRRRTLLIALGVLGAVVVLLLFLVLRPPEKSAVSIAPRSSEPSLAPAAPAIPTPEPTPDAPPEPTAPEPEPTAAVAPPPPTAPEPTAPEPEPTPAADVAPPEPEQVTLRFEVAPTNAEIRVEGVLLEQRRWTGPAGDTPLDIRVTAPGHRRKKLRVAPSEDRTIEVRLRRRAPSRRKSASPSDGLLFDGSDL